MSEKTNERDELVLHDEEAYVDVETRVAGRVGVRKAVETEQVRADVPVRREEADVERIPAGPDDSGRVETLEDGSVSIPVLAEEIVVTKRVVVRERVIVRKRIETDERRVETEVRREVAEIDETPAGSPQS